MVECTGGGRTSHGDGGTYSTFGDGHSGMQVHRQWALCIGIACGVSVPRGTRLPAAVCEAQPCGAGQVGASCVRSRVRTRLVGQEGTNGAAGGAQRARGGPENVDVVPECWGRWTSTDPGLHSRTPGLARCDIVDGIHS